MLKQVVNVDGRTSTVTVVEVAVTDMETERDSMISKGRSGRVWLLGDTDARKALERSTSALARIMATEGR